MWRYLFSTTIYQYVTDRRSSARQLKPDANPSVVFGEALLFIIEND